ncbi:MAG: hypothetical protein IPK26_16770 [Planctomycetes bacterium]|nr:hypothetical protein [Planctomycetota bacterium]
MRVATWSLWLLAACGAPADPLPAEPEPPAHTRIDLPSLAACGSCHLRQYEEWAQSLHHGAWTNDNVRAATRNFEREECRCCHSPMPVLPHSLVERPPFRDFNHDDGVHCLSCHGLADGVAATRDIPDAPCRPRADARLQQAELCQPCHEPTHQAFAEYRLSAAFADGVRCADCHMPEREDGSGRSHGPHGGLNAAFVRKALRWSCAIADGELVVTLRNKTGHKFPGEIPSRSFVLQVELPGREPIRELLRRPHKGEDRADNRLLPDEERVLRFPLGDGVAAADVLVRFLFLPLPMTPIEQAFVLGEWRGDG